MNDQQYRLFRRGARLLGFSKASEPPLTQGQRKARQQAHVASQTLNNMPALLNHDRPEGKGTRPGLPKAAPLKVDQAKKGQGTKNTATASKGQPYKG